MSSLRKINVPPFARARSCAVQNVRAWPRCNNPVGDGASRPRYFGLRPPSLRFVAARISDFGFKGWFASIREIRVSKRFARICREPPGQTGQWNGQYLLDFGDVQRRVQRARRAGTICRQARCDFWIELRPARRNEPADLPARKFFRAGNVEQPGASLIHHFPNRARRLAGKNRAAKFVREQIHPLPRLPCEPQVFVETAIARARYAAIERRAHNGVARIAQNDLLGGGFHLAIQMNRVHRVSLGVIPLAPVKNQIRGKENERNVCRESGQKRGRVHIQTPRQIGIRLRSGNGADGGAMNDQLRLVITERAANGIEISKFKTTNIPRRKWERRHGVPPGVREGRHVAVPDQANDAPARGKSRRGLDEIISNQPVCAGDPGKRF